MSSSSDTVSLYSSNSGSVESRRDVGKHVEEESTSPMAMVGRIPMETVIEVREDPPEEIVENNWPAKAGYDWVGAEFVVELYPCYREKHGLWYRVAGAGERY